MAPSGKDKVADGDAGDAGDCGDGAVLEKMLSSSSLAVAAATAMRSMRALCCSGAVREKAASALINWLQSLEGGRKPEVEETKVGVGRESVFEGDDSISRCMYVSLLI